MEKGIDRNGQHITNKLNEKRANSKQKISQQKNGKGNKQIENQVRPQNW